MANPPFNRSGVARKLSRRQALCRLVEASLTTLAGLSLAGCAPPIDLPGLGDLARDVLGQAQQATGSAPAPKVLRWLTPIALPPDDSATPTVSSAADLTSRGWSTMLAPWKASHPSITLVADVVASADLTRQQIAAAQSGAPGDVAYTEWGRFLGEAGALDPLDVGSLARKIVPAAFPPQTALDQVYALPVFVTTLGLFLNRRRFEAAELNPTALLRDWSSFETAVQKLTSRARQLYGVDVFGSGSPLSGQARYAPFLWSAGGSFFDDDGGEALWDRPPGLDALIYLARLSQNYASPGAATAPDATLVQNWLGGQTATLLGGPEVTAAADERELSYGVQSVPAYIQGQASSVVTSAGAVGVFARSRHKDWALDLCRYLASKEAQVAGLTYLRLLPANVDAGDAAPVFQRHAALGQFLRILREDDVHAFPLARARNAEVQEIFRVYLGLALQGQATPKVAWTRAAAEANALLKAALTPTPERQG